jgi:uncharacterized protein (DUF1778 family)
MHLDRYIDQVHAQLGAAAALGDERTQQVAQTLAGTATSAIRLAILGALGEAADEITAALLDTPGAPSVSVRLDGDDVRVDVQSTAGPEPVTPRAADEGEATARISLRLSESLKAEVEQAAGGEGVSVNTWLVRAASNALGGGWRFGPGGAFGPGGPFGPGGNAQRRRGGGNAHHVTGWIDG